MTSGASPAAASAVWSSPPTFWTWATRAPPHALLCGILASHPVFAVMTGDASLRRRPMRRVIEPLTATGARFTAREGGRLPLAIKGARDAMPLDYRVPVPSAQVKSAVLLAGLNAPGITRVEEPEATRDHSENMLRHFRRHDQMSRASGAGRIIELRGQPELLAADVVVPGDPSSAAFPLVAALLVPGSKVTIPAVGLNPLRTGLLRCLEGDGRRHRAISRVAGPKAANPVGDMTVTGGGVTAWRGCTARARAQHDRRVSNSRGRGGIRPRHHPVARVEGSSGSRKATGWRRPRRC